MEATDRGAVTVEDTEMVVRAFRRWALANVARFEDRRRCGHNSLLDLEHELTCVQCAIELGRRRGHLEAGAFLTATKPFV